MSDEKRVKLESSRRQPMAGARKIGRIDPQQKLQVSVILRRRNPLPEKDWHGEYLTREEFAKSYGADPADIKRVHEFAREFGLQVVPTENEIGRRTVLLEGTAAQFEKAFAVQLNQYEHSTGTYRGREDMIEIPASMSGTIEAVLGMDSRPQAKPHFRWLTSRPVSAASAAADISYTPVQVAQLYDFPTDVSGSGETIGIIELGGGYNPSDIQQYFASLGLTPPTVTSVSVDGGANQPTNANSADGEVLLDIEVAGGVAPGAKIVVYFAPNTSQGFQDALSMAIHDSKHNPSVISISWGGPESTWTQQSLQSFDSAAQSGAAMGVTITVACGDNGSSDGVNDGGNHVDFPASSPNVLAAGGTRLDSAGGKITSETVWNDGQSGGATGGGFSAVFPRPGWQSAVAQQTGRGVPDVASDADPASGYSVLVDGQTGVIGGTSAAAPLWAGLIALLNQKLGQKVGFANPTFYGLPASAKAFRDITSGNNGAYKAGPGWDPTTGLGTPQGTALAAALAGAGGMKRR